ncbi:hypothetical protein [Cytobacillus sp. IB215665]|uniref:hypothetical protein n=1 Tax=Cytobacillus sp. IB215665 TaxID=3097357 RepID=UPI002A0DAEA1|nr:hypothetical protein [Cytobacillus sp. IB215665]MDX8367222.1 hypothetical protein [Cytobacillus sp. IB215665]
MKIKQIMGMIFILSLSAYITGCSGTIDKLEKVNETIDQQNLSKDQKRQAIDLTEQYIKELFPNKTINEHMDYTIGIASTLGSGPSFENSDDISISAISSKDPNGAIANYSALVNLELKQVTIYMIDGEEIE